MALSRDDRTITDAQGRAIAGAQVWYCTQPLTSGSSLPPAPLAVIYGDLQGSSVLTQPLISDGFGHVFAYMDDTLLYSVVVSSYLLGPSPIIWPDQDVGGGSGGIGLMPVQETPQGTIDGTNTVFTLTKAAQNATIYKNYPLIPGLGYTLDVTGKVITYATAPQPGQDNVFASYFTSAGLVPTTPTTPPTITLNTTGVGTGASVSLSTGSTAYAGTVTLNTGSSPFVGQVLLMTFVSSPAPTNSTVLMIFPRTINCLSVGLFGGASNAGGCQLDSSTGVAANTTYTFNYFLVQI